jgi:hypothetical protein
MKIIKNIKKWLDKDKNYRLIDLVFKFIGLLITLFGIYLGVGAINNIELKEIVAEKHSLPNGCYMQVSTSTTGMEFGCYDQEEN